jgi:hypothetical protein
VVFTLADARARIMGGFVNQKVRPALEAAHHG